MGEVGFQKLRKMSIHDFFTPFFQPNWFHYIFDRFMRLVSPKKLGCILLHLIQFSPTPIFDYMRDMSHVSKHQWHRNQLAPAIEHPSRLNRRLERVQKTVVELEGEKDQWFLHNSWEQLILKTCSPKKRFWVPNNRTFDQKWHKPQSTRFKNEIVVPEKSSPELSYRFVDEF